MSQQPSDATFDDGTSRLQLRGNISAGLLDVECQDFITGNDTFTVVRGTIAGQPIYRAFFSYEGGRILVLQLKDADVGMTVVFSDDDTGTNTHMTVTHDGQPPQTFTINKSFAVEKGDLQAAIVGSDQDPKAFDLVGRRPVPDITPGELFDTFGALPGLQQFLRGAQSEASRFSTQKSTVESDIRPDMLNFCYCIFACLIPACGLACLLCPCVRGH